MSEVYEFKPKSDRKRRAEVIDVVRKLLAETVERGCTEVEALAYAKKAQAMMAEHDITMADIEGAEEKEKSHEDDVVNPPGHPMPNVRRFLAAEYAHPDHCLLLHQGGQFYRWDGTCWPAIEEPILRSRLYKWFEKKFVQVGDKLVPFAPNTSKVTNLIDAARAITVIETTKETPSWLGAASTTSMDVPIDADEIISCQNGLVHWPKRVIAKHRPGYYVHHSVPFTFDASAPVPTRWLAFLNELWPDDQSSIDTLQEMFGYLVSGDTRQQKMFLLVGPKRGGKGTIGRVLTRMLGKHNVAGPTLASLGTNFGMQDLIGKPVAIVSDARIGAKSDASLIAERLLSVSGEDLQNVDRKYLPPWSGYLPTRFVILTNELPRFTDSSGALASRFVVLLLKHSFYGRENSTLTKELCEELPGIFNWALDGLQRLRERGRFEQPVTSADAIREMEDLASPIGAFIRDGCVLGYDESVEVEALYKHYRRWCDENGHKACSATTFGRDMRAARPEIKRYRPGTGPNRPYHYAGISMGTSWDVVDVNGGDGNHVHNVLGLRDRYTDMSDGDGQHDLDQFGTVKLEPAKSDGDRVAYYERLGLPHAKAVDMARRTKER